MWLNETLAALDYLPLTLTLPEPAATGGSASLAGSTTKAKPPASTTPANSTSSSAAVNRSPANATASASATAAGPASDATATANTTASIDAAASPTSKSTTTTAAKHSTSAPVPSLAATLALQFHTGAFKPVTGKWKWNGSYPSSLERLWNPNAATVITEGAIMRFQADHGLAVDGVAGPNVYRALQQALTKKSLAAHPYTYVTVSKASPEHLDVWQNGRKVFSSLANTGISASPTPNGTWPVYSRLLSQTMQEKIRMAAPIMIRAFPM
ncbi:peptidoglycan-binding domain-containing protein [Alicyclobacillus fastidiosus]|uniref:peptidoglycan-binding domain-containing protein n=1 Tax=Alicyclobacillus fastidiosus TaxID=392011 RepID=UPI0024E18F6B|nr:L,D-transpeptidase family protein [Alicyclobacillus fastidiosus]